jgi:Uma2 family endonuclease
LLHQLAGDRVQTLLEASAPPGLLAMTAVGVRLTDAGVIPDVVVARESAVLAGGALLSASDVRLVVEIVSPSTRMMDRRIKPEIYAAAGIANFWRLEPRPFRGQLKTERLPVLLAYSLNAESAYEVIQRVDASEPATLKHPFPVDIDLAGLLPTNAIDG